MRSAPLLAGAGDSCAGSRSGDRPGERQLRADLVAEAGHEHQACLGRDTRDALLVVLPTSNDPSTEGAVGFIGHVVRALMKLAARGVSRKWPDIGSTAPARILVRGLEAVVDDGPRMPAPRVTSQASSACTSAPGTPPPWPMFLSCHCWNNQDR